MEAIQKISLKNTCLILTVIPLIPSTVMMLIELIAKSLPIEVLVNDAYLRLDVNISSYYGYLWKINDLLDSHGISFFCYILQILIIQGSIVVLRKHVSKKLFLILLIATVGLFLLCGIAALIQLIVYLMSKTDTLSVQIMKSFENGLIAKEGTAAMFGFKAYMQEHQCCGFLKNGDIFQNMDKYANVYPEYCNQSSVFRSCYRSFTAKVTEDQNSGPGLRFVKYMTAIMSLLLQGILSSLTVMLHTRLSYPLPPKRETLETPSESSIADSLFDSYCGDIRMRDFGQRRRENVTRYRIELGPRPRPEPSSSSRSNSSHGESRNVPESGSVHDLGSGAVSELDYVPESDVESVKRSEPEREPEPVAGPSSRY